MLENMSLDDMKRFVLDFGTPVRFFDTVIVELLKKKSQLAYFEESLISFQHQILEKLEAPKALYEIRPLITLAEVDRKYQFTLDPNVLLLRALYVSLMRKDEAVQKEIEELGRLEDLYYSEMEKEEYIEGVKAFTRELKAFHNVLIAKTDPLDQQKNTLLDNRKALTWIIKHVEEVMMAFQAEVPNSILEQLNQGKLLLFLAHSAYVNSRYAEAKTMDSMRLKPLEYMNNYALYARHQKELMPNYEPSYKFNSENGADVMTTELFLKQMDLIEEYEPELMVYGCKDFEELLKTKLTDLNRQIKKEQFRKDIMLGWELIPESISKNERIRGIGRRTKTEEERKFLEEKKEALVEEKIELFNSLPYLAAIKGVNHFEGYFAYVFENGKVIFEKFYKKTKQGLVPTIDEAIYVIGIESFAELSRQSKGEIRDFIKEGKDKKAKVINHTKTFKQRVRNEVSGEGYTQEVMDYIDALIAKEESIHPPQYQK